MRTGPEPRRLPDGSIAAPDGRVYRQTAERVKRGTARILLDAGAAVVTEMWPDEAAWYDGHEAASVWREIEPDLVVGPAPPVTDVQWVGRVWRSDDGRVVLVFRGRH